MVAPATALAQSRGREGAAVGGTVGAIIGGIIGHQNDETPEGALIGGAVGALTGGLIGKSQDEELARQREYYYRQQAYYAQQQAYAQQQTQQAVARAAVHPADLLRMSQSGVSDALVISQLQQKGVPRRLEIAEIIELHNQGVRDSLIEAYQRAPLATELVRASAAAPAAAPTWTQSPPVVVQPRVVRPVIVEEAPVYYRYHCAPWHHHGFHHYHYPAHSGFSIRLGF
ncbi:MAG: glycine zipper 2TM domain-containing protein [Planctomycetota bacterium]|nr:MAG: glycine zipper 2TM domain-containing protein [Planctomycetota bacterium]